MVYELPATPHHRPTMVRRCDQRFRWRKPELGDEQFQVSGIATLRCTRQPVVAAGNDTYAAPVKLAHVVCGYQQFRFEIASGLGTEDEAVFLALMEIGVWKADCWSDEDGVLHGLDQVECLGVGQCSVERMR